MSRRVPPPPGPGDLGGKCWIYLSTHAKGIGWAVLFSLGPPHLTPPPLYLLLSPLLPSAGSEKDGKLASILARLLAISAAIPAGGASSSSSDLPSLLQLIRGEGSSALKKKNDNYVVSYN